MMTLNECAASVSEWRASKGFITPSVIDNTPLKLPNPHYKNMHHVDNLGGVDVSKEILSNDNEHSSLIVWPSNDLMLGKIALIAEEVGELVTAVRKNDMENFKEELIDIIIRCFDISGTMGIDLEREFDKKWNTLQDRVTRHGKNTLL